MKKFHKIVDDIIYCMVIVGISLTLAGVGGMLVGKFIFNRYQDIHSADYPSLLCCNKDVY